MLARPFELFWTPLIFDLALTPADPLRSTQAMNGYLTLSLRPACHLVSTLPGD